MSDVTSILSQIESGDPSAAAQLLPLVYQELRHLAAARLAHEKPGQTLQATALVHEAYLRLIDAPDWDLLDLDGALDRLETQDPRAAKLVKLRFFAGLTRSEAAQALGVSIATADNDWAYAKGWLQVHLGCVTDPKP